MKQNCVLLNQRDRCWASQTLAGNGTIYWAEASQSTEILRERLE